MIYFALSLCALVAAQGDYSNMCNDNTAYSGDNEFVMGITCDVFYMSLTFNATGPQPDATLCETEYSLFTNGCCTDGESVCFVDYSATCVCPDDYDGTVALQQQPLDDGSTLDVTCDMMFAVFEAQGYGLDDVCFELSNMNSSSSSSSSLDFGPCCGNGAFICDGDGDDDCDDGGDGDGDGDGDED